MKVFYIVNLNSGKSVIGAKLGSVVDILTKSGMETTIYSTQSRGDATVRAKEACESGKYDYILCSGGDGTFSEVINGVMNASIELPVGYIPTGSTNDFAKGLGIPLNVEKAAEAFVDGKKVLCDVGVCNDKTFLYVAAFGVFTDISYETPQNIKNILGHVAYIFNGISKLGKYTEMSCNMKVEYISEKDEKISVEGNFVYGMVTNSSSVAGFLSLDNFLYDDGVFEVTLVKKPKNLIDFHKIVTSLNNIKEGADKDVFVSFRAKKAKFTIVDNKDIPWTLDGEFGGKEKVHIIENKKRAVTLIVDKDNIPEDKFVE